MPWCLQATSHTLNHCWPRPVTPYVRISLGHHDDVIKWKHFPCYWPFVRGIHQSSVNSTHKCQWRGVLMFSLICVWINDWVNNREAGDLRRHRGHYDVTIMQWVNGFAEQTTAPGRFIATEIVFELMVRIKIYMHYRMTAKYRLIITTYGQFISYIFTRLS